MAASYRVSVGGVAHEIEVAEDGAALSVQIDGEVLHADLEHVGGPVLTLLLNGRSFEVVAVERPDGYEVLIGNQVFEVEVGRPGRRGGAAALAQSDGGPTQLKTPLTGTVIDVRATPGASVSGGQVLVVVESMKMNNEIRAPRDGVVAEVHVKAGDRVERNALLVTIT